MKEGSLSQVQSLLVFFLKTRMSAAVIYLAGLLWSLLFYILKYWIGGAKEETIREIPLFSVLPQEPLQSEDFILCNSSEAGPSHGAMSS